jgi:hypothetical protein
MWKETTLIYFSDTAVAYARLNWEGIPVKASIKTSSKWSIYKPRTYRVMWQ